MESVIERYFANIRFSNLIKTFQVPYQNELSSYFSEISFSWWMPPCILEITGVILKMNNLIAKYEMTNLKIIFD